MESYFSIHIYIHFKANISEGCHVLYLCRVWRLFSKLMPNYDWFQIAMQNSLEPCKASEWLLRPLIYYLQSRVTTLLRIVKVLILSQISHVFSVLSLVKSYTYPLTQVYTSSIKMLRYPFRGEGWGKAFQPYSTFSHSLAVSVAVHEAFSQRPHTNARFLFSTNTQARIWTGTASTWVCIYIHLNFC